MKNTESEKVYTATVCVGNYEIVAYGRTKDEVISLIWKKYGESGFKKNGGFQTKKAFCEYHGLDNYCVEEIEIGKAYVW